ncbi:VOC family protein [Rhodococcus sp. Z13]|uniref:VOC family protein n=1 Tax=Rhodococcus sacchari TaxID=2962047 RepID=A0ACD4DIA6_9NOCA|nr:VOC family protein [Rhodococcus sp. Z13]UYP19766.1 VOC family protein [Rhodococcus sp. Z13]
MAASAPKSTPNLFLVYVTDVDRATRFYSDLFGMSPEMVTPRYVSFEVAPGMLFALWSGRAETVTPDAPRFSEVGLMLPGSADAVDALFEQWEHKGVTVVEKPHDEVFGRTFVVADPDGNLIRVSPLDRGWDPDELSVFPTAAGRSREHPEFESVPPAGFEPVVKADLL